MTNVQEMLFEPGHRHFSADGLDKPIAVWIPDSILLLSPVRRVRVIGQVRRVRDVALRAWLTCIRGLLHRTLPKGQVLASGISSSDPFRAGNDDIIKARLRGKGRRRSSQRF